MFISKFCKGRSPLLIFAIEYWANDQDIKIFNSKLSVIYNLILNFNSPTPGTVECREGKRIDDHVQMQKRFYEDKEK